MNRGNMVFIVHEGALIHDGAIIERKTAPAGIDQTNIFSFVISNFNRYTNYLFSGSWMESTRLEWETLPPQELGANEHHTFFIAIQPSLVYSGRSHRHNHSHPRARYGVLHTDPLSCATTNKPSWR